MRPPQHSIDASDQLQHFKGLDDIIVRTQRKSLYSVLQAVPRSNDYDGGGSKLLDHCEAIHAWKHEIQQNQVRRFFSGHSDGGNPVKRL